MDDHGPDDTDDGTRVTRRRLIRGGAVIAGLGVVGAVAPQEAQAADGGSLVLGQANTAESPTTLTVSDAGPGLAVASGGVGVLGTIGSQAFDPNDAPPAAAGVYGLADQGVGVVGRSTSQIGVLGTTGAQAFDPNDAPPAAAGVYGLSTDAGMPGVLAAQHGGGVGLRVEGRTVLSTAGRGTISKGSSTKTVNHPSVQSNSVVLVTLNGGAGGAALRFVQVADGSFTVKLSEAASKAAPFSFLVLN